MIDPSIILGALSVLFMGAIALKLGLHSDCRIDTTAERMSAIAPQPIRIPLIEEERRNSRSDD
jgi:hypothetical protein